MPKKRKVKKTKKKGAGWGKKVLLGVAGLGTAGLMASAYKVKSSGFGNFLAKNAANRSRYKVAQNWGSRWN